MRLPFGAYTGIEILDTLEVVAHERYEELLEEGRRPQRGVRRLPDPGRALRLNAQGQQVVVTETVTASIAADRVRDGGRRAGRWSWTPRQARSSPPSKQRTAQVGQAVRPR